MDGDHRPATPPNDEADADADARADAREASPTSRLLGAVCRCGSGGDAPRR